jgi:alanyl-tRNA synthetase
MGAAYPELTTVQDRVTAVLRQEEERFAETLENGMKVLEAALTREDKMLDGDTVFQLYDTFGFPVDLTADIARERNVHIDHAGFEAAMERQRERARAASKFQMGSAVEFSGAKTQFKGYDTLAVADAEVIAIYREGTSVQSIASGEAGIVVLPSPAGRWAMRGNWMLLKARLLSVTRRRYSRMSLVITVS